MLKFIRRNPDALWIKGLFAVIAGIFIFWGFGLGDSNGSARTQISVGKVNGESIDEDDYLRTYNNMLRFYQDIYKENFKPELLAGMDLKGKALDQLVRSRLVRQEAERLGLEVTDAEIRDSIAGLPSFQQDGRFDVELYKRVLRYNKLNPSDFEEAQRQELLVKKLQDIVGSGVAVSEAEAKERYQFENDKVEIQFVHFDNTKFTTEVQLSEDDVKAYYDKNKEAFELPDQARVEYVQYAADGFADKVEVGDADLQTYFDGHQAEFAKPEQVHARHILLKVEADTAADAKEKVRKQAEEVLAKAKAGDDFAKLAEQYSEDAGSAKKGGDLGFFKRGQMVPTFEAVAFSTDPGSISDLVESPFGFHIIKVEAKQEASTPPLTEVREQVLAKVKAEKAREAARTQASSDHQKLTQGESLANLAQASGLSVVTPAAFGRGEVIENLGRSPLSNAAFSVEANQVGPVVDTPQGFIVFRTLERIAAHLPALDQVRAKVEEAARLEKASDIAKQKAQAVLDEAKKSNLDTAAKAAGLEVQETSGFPRSGNYIPKLGNSDDLKKAAFQLTKEAPLAPNAFVVDGDAYAVALKERIAADEAQFATQKDSLIKQAEQRRKAQVTEDFVNQLIAKAKIERNDTYLASLTESGRPLNRIR